MRVVVVGGAGVLGRLVCAEVRIALPDAELLVGTRRGGAARLAGDLEPPARPVRLDPHDPASIRRALDGADLAIIAVAQDTPRLQEVCLDLGVHSVDVGIAADLAAQVRALDRRAVDAGLTAVTMAGLFPGLSGLLIREATDRLDSVDHVDVCFRQHTNARVGRTGVVDMLKIVSTPVRRGSTTVRGFRRRARGEHGPRLIEHPERAVVSAGLAIGSVDYRTGWNSRSFDTLVAALVAIRALPRLAPRIARLTSHDPTRPEDIDLRVRARGTLDGRPIERSVGLSATSDYGATAAVAVALGVLAVRGAITGAGVPFALTTLDDVLAVLRDGLVTRRTG